MSMVHIYIYRKRCLYILIISLCCFTKYSTALHDVDICKKVRDFWKMLMALKNLDYNLGLFYKITKTLLHNFISIYSSIAQIVVHKIMSRQ